MRQHGARRALLRNEGLGSWPQAGRRRTAARLGRQESEVVVSAQHSRRAHLHRNSSQVAIRAVYRPRPKRLVKIRSRRARRSNATRISGRICSPQPSPTSSPAPLPQRPWSHPGRSALGARRSALRAVVSQEAGRSHAASAAAPTAMPHAAPTHTRPRRRPRTGRTRRRRTTSRRRARTGAPATTLATAAWASADGCRGRRTGAPQP